MRLDGVHHVTCITGDALENLDFYTRVLGLRLVKKSVNQDDPSVYHLFYADENGSAGSDITFFEYRGARPGRAGAGMIHRVVWRVASDVAVDFWESRLASEGIATGRGPLWLSFADREGLGHELHVVATDDEPLVAAHPEIPAELALQGFHGVRAYGADPEASRWLLEALGFEPQGDSASWATRGESRSGFYCYDPPPSAPGSPGAGTVHHVAWSSTLEEHARWRDRLAITNAHPTPIIDRFWFRSTYFREPSGVLFEIATLGPGFATDEAPEHLGEALVLPPAFESLRGQIERILTPLPNPRASWSVR